MLHTHSHHFIQNKEVDALYFAVSLLSFAEGLISIFVPIFLWSLGFRLPLIILFYLLEAGYFVILSYFSAGLMHRFTDKNLIIMGVPFLVLYYGLLPLAQSLGWVLFLVPIFIAMYRLTFNVGYHTDFSCASDEDDSDLGDEVGMQYMLTSLTQFASPLLGGLLIATSGYGVTFWLATFIAAVALIPLMFFKGHPMAIDKITPKKLYGTIFSEKYRNIAVSSAGYAVEATTGSVFWPLYIFLIFSSTKTVGGIYSFLGLLMAITSFITGRVANKERYGKMITLTIPAIALIWIARAFFPSEAMILISTPVKSILYAIMIVGWSGIYYMVTKQAKSCGTLVMASETIFTLARTVVLSLLLLLSFLVPQDMFFVALFVVAALSSLLMAKISKQVA